jgi:hypothetical protein
MKSTEHADDDDNNRVRSSSPTPKAQSTLHAVTIYDKPLNESQSDDIQRLTVPCHYHDGDSIQQTYVCSQPGNYVLQWRHVVSHHTTSPFDFISGSHKTKIMYHYERLSPTRLSTDMTTNGYISDEQRTSLTSS